MYEEQLIQEAGLTQGEAKVYLALLEIGSSSAGPIIDKAKVARSFIYNILNHLIDKGLVGYVIKDKTRIYTAADPDRILDYINKRQDELEKKKHEVEQLIPKLNLLSSMSQKTKVNIYEGFKGIQTCFENYENHLKEGEEYLCLGVLTEQTQKFHNYWKRHHLKREKQKVKARMLFNQGTSKEVLVNRNSYKDCDSRYMPTNVQTPSWFFIYKDTCAIFLQAPQQFAIEIQNKEIAQTMRTYFEDFWRLSKPFSQ